MKKYTYLVNYNYFGDNCGGDTSEFIVLCKPIVDQKSYDKIIDNLGWSNEATIQILNVALMNIE